MVMQQQDQVPYDLDKRMKARDMIIDFSADTVTVSQGHYDWIREAYNYGSVSPLSAAARKLTEIRKAIISGKAIDIQTQDATKISDIINFDKWVANKFPDLIETELYPVVDQQTKIEFP